MEKSATLTAFVAAVLAGQLGLAGLVLVFQGIILTRYIDLKDSPNPPKRRLRALRLILWQNTVSVGVMLSATIVPTMWFFQAKPDDWPVIAVFALSAGLTFAVSCVSVVQLTKS